MTELLQSQPNSNLCVSQKLFCNEILLLGASQLNSVCGGRVIREIRRRRVSMEPNGAQVVFVGPAKRQRPSSITPQPSELVYVYSQSPCLLGSSFIRRSRAKTGNYTKATTTLSVKLHMMTISSRARTRHPEEWMGTGSSHSIPW